MNIRIHFRGPYQGVAHSRDFRTPACMASGDGGRTLHLSVDLTAQQGQPEYCGVLVNNRTEERSVPLAVRVHRTLELADDKFYVITCGKAGFKNARNETSLVSLRILDQGRRAQETIYGRPYTLRAEISKPDGAYGIRVKNCFAFNKKNTSVSLIDERGCPRDEAVISEFHYDPSSGTADAELRSMFRFQDGTEVHIQCAVAICRGACENLDCNDPDSHSSLSVKGAQEDGVVLAATSVFVLDPGETPALQAVCDSGVHPSWLLWLCIALGVLFLIMLLINIFLCSAMTCSCARTEVIEKEPSIIEEYDPYRSWHGSQYGSRYSLHGGHGNGKGYASGGSTIHSTRSVSPYSDHYAVLHSRPGSRYSAGPQGHNRTQPRGTSGHM